MIIIYVSLILCIIYEWSYNHMSESYIGIIYWVICMSYDFPLLFPGSKGLHITSRGIDYLVLDIYCYVNVQAFWRSGQTRSAARIVTRTRLATRWVWDWRLETRWLEWSGPKSEIGRPDHRPHLPKTIPGEVSSTFPFVRNRHMCSLRRDSYMSII